MNSSVNTEKKKQKHNEFILLNFQLSGNCIFINRIASLRCGYQLTYQVTKNSKLFTQVLRLKLTLLLAASKHFSRALEIK